MTLIVKELVVRGIVSSEDSPLDESFLKNDDLMHLLEQMKKEIEKECIDKIEQRFESRTNR